jgi:putative photosynthetic complex assembly protein 2
MLQYALPVLFTLFVWWFSTGVILMLDGLPRWTFKWTMVGATVVLALSLVGLAVTAHDTRTGGAYAAFLCAVLVWAWQEIAFLLGYVTGPRRTSLPAGAAGWRRTWYALQTVLHHELALLVLGAAVVAVTWGGSNPTGLWAFMILWVMRQSAKLNVFLGVRNLAEDFLPAHLRYLQSYFRRRPMNSLFPVSVIGSTLCVAAVWQAAFAQGVERFDATSLTFAGTLLTLAIVEHWFMVLPLRFERLWQWSLRGRAGAAVV